MKIKFLGELCCSKMSAERFYPFFFLLVSLLAQVEGEVEAAFSVAATAAASHVLQLPVSLFPWLYDAISWRGDTFCKPFPIELEERRHRGLVAPYLQGQVGVGIWVFVNA